MAYLFQKETVVSNNTKFDSPRNNNQTTRVMRRVPNTEEEKEALSLLRTFLQEQPSVADHNRVCWLVFHGRTPEQASHAVLADIRRTLERKAAARASRWAELELL